MSFPRYPRYKDSGVQWLGEVPEHWRVLQGRRLFEQRKEPVLSTDEQLSATQKYGVVPQQKFMEEEDQKVTLALSGTGSFKHVDKDDFVISLRSFQGGIEHSAYAGCVSPAYTVLRPVHDMHPRYWAYALKSAGFISELQSVTDGIRDGKNVSYQQFGSLGLPLCPLTEQVEIAGFLDQEVARIDALMAEQQRLIELLKEKRQGVISHAVTRGLSPDAPMKPSGVEWLGDIPSHWTTTKLKYAASLIVDCPHETPVYSDDGTYLVIRTADVDEGRLDPSAMRRVSEDTYVNRVRRSPVLRDDIVYGREGERWGHAARVPESDRYCLGQRMMQFRAAAGINPGYLMWALNADATYRQGEQDTIGATSPHVNISTIRSFVLALPPEEEQDAIEVFLREHLGRFDDVIDEASLAITLLQERRAALISAAVTGKIDVRGVAMAEAA